MKQFTWRLQRLLDLKIKEEDVKRDALVAVTEQAAAARSRILLERAGFRQMLSELRDKDGRVRLAEQQLLLTYTHVFDSRMKGLEEHLAALEKLRLARIEEILEIRKLRKGLEKLREKARSEFMRKEHKLEQHEADEHTSMRFARALIERS
ncbi:MAG: flagellar FliJ family protein [Phycisphaerae bacterium]|nr:flagellar FliJ family protein [Phycisphaerae bacterium]